MEAAPSTSWTSRGAIWRPRVGSSRRRTVCFMCSCCSSRPSRRYTKRSPRGRMSLTILCLILFCLQEEPLSSKQGGCAGRPQRAGQAGAADGGWEEPCANVGADGQGEDLQEADRGQVLLGAAGAGGGGGEGPRVAAPLKICLWIDLGLRRRQNNTM